MCKNTLNLESYKLDYYDNKNEFLTSSKMNINN